MKFIADFHIHSKYSRATSKEMLVEPIADVCRSKGIQLVGTGDFTHPKWVEELKEKLKPSAEGLFECNGVNFLLTAEVNNTYTKNGKLRRIHNLIFAPGFKEVESINKKLQSYGNLVVDGRPTLSIDSKNMVELLLAISEDILIIPGHIWTPWFSLFGANSGFDSIEECFEDLTTNIYGLETGLSSDPAMNWMLSSLDRFTLVSNSDAHSPSRIGREANCFDCRLSYYEICDVIRKKDRKRFLFTIEFYPEEGKYHYDGHRKCGVRSSPSEAIANNDICPICGRRLTIGVLHRVQLLSDRKEGYTHPDAIPFKRLVPLQEIIADLLKVGKDTQVVHTKYEKLIQTFKTEFNILLDVPYEDIEKGSDPKIAEGIKRVREGRIRVEPGYDGVYGEIKIFDEDSKTEQIDLF